MAVGKTFSRVRRDGRGVTLSVQERWDAEAGQWRTVALAQLIGTASNADGSATATIDGTEGNLAGQLTPARLAAVVKLAQELVVEWMAARAVTEG